MALAMNGNIIELKAGDKILYHAAAVIVSNYLITLMKMAADLWQSFDISAEDAINAMLPLLKGTVNNIEQLGIPGVSPVPSAGGTSVQLKNTWRRLKKGIQPCLILIKCLAWQRSPLHWRRDGSVWTQQTR